MRLEEGIFTLCDLWLLTFRVELCVVLQQELRQRSIVKSANMGFPPSSARMASRSSAESSKLINREVLYETFAGVTDFGIAMTSSAIKKRSAV